MKVLYVMCGCPGSGKSTWIRENFSKFHGLTAVVSRDDIRFMLVSSDEEYFSKEKEVYNKYIEDIKLKLRYTDNVIADATHLNEGSRSKLLRNLGMDLKDVKVNAIVIRVPLETALKQNEKRKDTREYVPVSAIKRMYSQFTMPSFDEGFDTIYVYRNNNGIPQYSIFDKEDKK